MEVTVAERQGSGREAVAERSRRQNTDRRNTNRQRGCAWATSMLGNAKSDLHPDARSRAGRRGMKVDVLTRGDLRGESRGEVSRGRSSDESRRKAEGAKDRRKQSKALQSIERRGIPGPDVSRPRGELRSCPNLANPSGAPPQVRQGRDTRALACPKNGQQCMSK